MSLGFDVVRMIHAAETSLRHNGAPVPLDSPPRTDGTYQIDRRNGHGGAPLSAGMFGRRSDDVLAFSEPGTGDSHGGR
jgi:hypothetical protein